VKKLLLSTLSLSVSSLAFQTAQAADSSSESTQIAAATPSTPGTYPRSDTVLTQQQLDQIKKEVEKKSDSENYVHAYGLLQGYVNTSDSQRANTPDFTGAHARAGVAAAGGIASGQLEFEFLGNSSLYNTSPTSPLPTDPVSGTQYTPATTSNTVVLRQAQLNLDVIKARNSHGDFTTTVSLGGVRVGNALAVAPDAANATSGFSRQDGLYLQEKMKFGKAYSLNVGLGAFNGINGTIPGAVYGGWGNNPSLTLQNFWGNGALGNNLGYLVNFNGTYNLDDTRSVNAIGYYGFQKNAPYSTIGTSLQTVGNLSESRNVNHTEASVLYNDTNVFGSNGILSGNGVAVWYEREENARTMLVSGNVNSGLSYQNGLVDDAQVASLYGVGVGGDSEKFLTNMLQSGDRLTAAAALTSVVSSLGSSGANNTYNVNQFAVSVGYAVNTFEVAANLEYSKADKNLFSNTSSNPVNNEMRSYLTAAYVF